MEATLAQKREQLRKFYLGGIKPADDRRPIPEELAQGMVKDLVESGVSKDAKIGVFDTFLTLSLTLQEYGFTNLTLIEKKHIRLTSLQEKYYTNIKGICEKIQVKYYFPPINNLDNCNMKFDVIIGNPPYQSGTKSSGNTIWDKIVARSLELLNDGGYLSFINPPRWRQPEDALSYIYKDYQLVSLKINNAKVGNKVFKASTPFDVYTIQKVAPYKNTYIEFSDGVKGEYDVTKLPFIPNSMIDYWTNAFDNQGEKLDVHHSYSHEDRLKHISKVKTDTHVYPIVQKVTDDGLIYLYSSKPHLHQDVQKVVFRDQGKSFAQLSSGGCGKHTYYVLNTSDKVVNFLNSEEFETIKKSVLFSQRQVFPNSLSYIPIDSIS